MTMRGARVSSAGSMVHAGAVSRLAAGVIDMCIVSVASGLANDVASVFFDIFGLSLFHWGRSVLIALSLAIALGITFCCLPLAWSVLGCSPGKALLGIRVVGEDGEPPVLGRACVRLLGYWISALPLFFGFFWSLIDERHQAWHDRLAGTYVVRASRP
jgi:uncharacterized RDD family membrane protein YckC